MKKTIFFSGVAIVIVLAGGAWILMHRNSHVHQLSTLTTTTSKRGISLGTKSSTSTKSYSIQPSKPSNINSHSNTSPSTDTLSNKSTPSNTPPIQANPKHHNNNQMGSKATKISTKSSEVTGTSSGGYLPKGSENLLSINSAHPNQTPTLNQVISPYIAKLQALQSHYIGELTTVYNQAKAQYHSSSTSKHAIEVEYLPKFESLQNELQDQVNSLLFSLQTQLTTYGYSTQEVATLRQEYQQAVSTMMASFKH